jgi:putative flippase GtrA
MNIRISLWTRLREVMLFVGVGILNTGVDFTVLNSLILLTHHDQELWLLPFNGIAFLAAVINSYILNKRFTFRHSTPSERWGFLRFVVVNAGGLVVNSLIVWALSPLLDDILPRIIAINVSKTLATGVSLCWNYFAMRRWIFHRREKTVEVQPGAVPEVSIPSSGSRKDTDSHRLPSNVGAVPCACPYTPNPNVGAVPCACPNAVGEMPSVRPVMESEIESAV